MSTDITDAKIENGEKKKTGGPRGPRQWKDKPTLRERVMTQSLATYIKDETGKDVSAETVRAVRFCLPKWSTSDETSKLRQNMDRKLEKAKFQDKREKALAMLREAESELEKYADATDLDESDLDDDEEDDDADSVADYDDDADDETEDEEDIFGDDEKVSVTTK